MEEEQEQEGLDLQLQQSLAAEDVEASGQGGSDEGERYFLRHRHQWAPDEAAQRWGTRPAAFVQTSPRNGRRRNCLSSSLFLFFSPRLFSVHCMHGIRFCIKIFWGKSKSISRVFEGEDPNL